MKGDETMVNLKKLKCDEYKNISFEEIFGSSSYAYDLQCIADTAVRRVGCTKNITVRLLYDEDMSDIAYTDGKIITINTGVKFALRLRKNPAVFHIFVVGLLAHELGHIFWTEFDDGERFIEAIKNGRIYPSLPMHKNAVKYADALKKRCNRGLFAELAHSLDNILEDIFVNALQAETLGGLLAKGISFGNVLVAEEMPTVAEEKESATPDFVIAMNLLLSNLKSNRVYYGKYEGEFKPYVDTITNIAYEYVFKPAHTNRCIAVNLIICELWEWVEKMLADAKEQSQSSQNKGSSSSSDGQSGEGSSSGDGSDSGSQSNQSGNNGTDSSSDNHNSQGNSNGSDSDGSDNDFDEEQAKKTLSEILKKIKGQSKEQRNADTSDTAKANSKSGKKVSSLSDSSSSDSSSLMEKIENPPRFEESAGEAVARGKQNLSNQEFFESGEAESLATLQKILDTIAEQKAIEKSENELKRELERIKPQNFPNIHKNISISVNRPSYRIAAYKRIASEVKPTTDALVKTVKRILKEENLNGERRGRYYGKMLDTGKLYRTDLKVFKDRKQPKKEIDLALSLLIDESGSMWGDRTYNATITAIMFAEMCEQLNISYEVFGHTASEGHIYLNNYKNFDSCDKKDKYRLASIDSYYCNRDGAAICYAVQRLKKRQEQRKLFIIISDGQPNDTGYSGDKAKADLARLKNDCLKDGIDFVAAAIGSDKEIIKQIYGKCFLSISDLKSMPDRLGKLLKNKIVR